MTRRVRGSSIGRVSEDGGQHPTVRVESSDRAKAKEALDAHLAAGRLDAGEHEQRICLVDDARTRSELETLFSDLPVPHPDLSDVPSSTRANQSNEEGWDAEATLGLGILTGIAGFPMTLTLWATTGQWWWTVLVTIACATLVTGGVQQRKNRPVPVPDDAVPDRIVKFGETLGHLIKNSGNDNDRQSILEAAGVSSVMLSQYTRDQTRPSFQELVALADFFNVSLDYLVYGEPAHKLVYPRCRPATSITPRPTGRPP